MTNDVSVVISAHALIVHLCTEQVPGGRWQCARQANLRSTCLDYMTALSCTEKTKSALGGICGGHPSAPYAIFHGMEIFRFSPTIIPCTPRSKPLTTALD